MTKVEQSKTMARNIKQSRYEVNSEKYTNSKACMQLIPVQLRTIGIMSVTYRPEKRMWYQIKVIKI